VQGTRISIGDDLWSNDAIATAQVVIGSVIASVGSSTHDLDLILRHIDISA
jgi:hypothetical protein